MRVPQRTDYALRALTLLAMQPEGEVVPAGELAESLVLPRRFVEQQLSELSRSGIVTSVRGARGGYRLAQPASSISVGAVVSALQGIVLDVPRVQRSAVSEMWANTALALEAELSSETLADLARRQSAIDAESAGMYYI
jgi:Rrf2 family protein